MQEAGITPIFVECFLCILVDGRDKLFRTVPSADEKISCVMANKIPTCFFLVEFDSDQRSSISDSIDSPLVGSKIEDYAIWTISA